MTDKPTNATVIRSLSFDEQEIIRNILTLFFGGKDIDCDPTYSKGNFYKHGLVKPKYIFDKFPQTDDTVEADCTKLPMKDSSVEVVMFDPPFVIGGITYPESKDGSCIIQKRFAQFASWEELKELYSLSHRVS